MTLFIYINVCVCMCLEEIRKARLPLGRGGGVLFSFYSFHTIILLDYYSVRKYYFYDKKLLKIKPYHYTSSILTGCHSWQDRKKPHISIIYKFLILSYLFRGGEKKVWVLLRGQNSFRVQQILFCTAVVSIEFSLVLDF